MSRLMYLAPVVLFAGCATQKEPPMQVQRYSVAVPVECKEPEPDRPVMPTESLPPDTTLFPFAKAAAAEIELRDGYEGELRTALRACKKPIR